jgi:hypothetical protein
MEDEVRKQGFLFSPHPLLLPFKHPVGMLGGQTEETVGNRSRQPAGDER